MITITKLDKRFDRRLILDGISVTFERGQVSSLIGPSGGGKSTLLRCINGLERFDAGAIDVVGHVLGPTRVGSRPSAADRAVLREIRFKATMVFQQYGLFSHMTALENVMEAPVHVRKLPVPEVKERAAALLERVGLAHRRDAYPRELSGGEQQRVAIARALAMDPEVLLLDEPTSALDPERKLDVVKVLRDLAEGGATMVIVTHEAAVLREIATHAVCLREGRVVAAGKPTEVEKA